MKHYNIPIFINHVGCPNSCVFCNQKKINGQETDISPEEARKIIEEYLEMLPANSEIEVAFFGGTFTGISFELQQKYLEQVKPFIENGRVKGIRISTRPDSIDGKILEQLKKYNVTVIELGVQSLNQKVLDLTERNYKVECVEKSVELIKKYNIRVGIQLMLGLPESNREIDIESAKKAVELKPDMARVYPTLVLAGTKLETMYNSKKYFPYTVEEAVEVGKEVCKILERENIQIIRVGLQPSEDLREDGVIIAGPFHSAFRELIEGEIYFDFLSKFKDESLEVFAHEKNISKITGINKINKTRLGLRFIIKIDNNLKLDEILINNKKYLREDIIK